MKNTFLILLTTLFYFSGYAQAEITEKEIKDHILFLASEKNAGRYPGGKENKRLVKYIEKDFKKQGLLFFGDSYKQDFEARLRVAKGAPEKPLVNTCNVVGYIEGNDPILKMST